MPKNKKNQMTLINYIEFSKNINNFPVKKITIDIDIFFATNFTSIYYIINRFFVVHEICQEKIYQNIRQIKFIY